MSKKLTKIFNIGLIVIVMLTILGLFIATDFDFEISKSLFNKNNFFSVIFSRLAYYPAFFLLFFISTFVFKFALNKEFKKNKKMLFKIIGVFGIFVTIITMFLTAFLKENELLIYLNTKSNISKYSYLIIILSILIISALFIFLSYIFIDNIDKDTIKLIITIGCVIILNFFVIYLIHLFLKRPTYRLIYDGLYIDKYIKAEDLYTFWYEFDNNFIFKNLTDRSKYPLYEFKSFPSKNLIFASLSLFLVLLPKFNNKIKDKSFIYIIFFIISLALIVSFSFARLIIGGSYLTDILFTFIITIVNYFISFILIKKLYNK